MTATSCTECSEVAGISTQHICCISNSTIDYEEKKGDNKKVGIGRNPETASTLLRVSH